jgi:hypothetical protein
MTYRPYLNRNGRARGRFWFVPDVIYTVDMLPGLFESYGFVSVPYGSLYMHPIRVWQQISFVTFLGIENHVAKTIQSIDLRFSGFQFDEKHARGRGCSVAQ